jgi:hypothetical protein
MLDEQTTVLTNLGSGEEATLLRAKMQSRSLLSDMESFKVTKFQLNRIVLDMSKKRLICEKKTCKSSKIILTSRLPVTTLLRSIKSAATHTFKY